MPWGLKLTPLDKSQLISKKNPTILMHCLSVLRTWTQDQRDKTNTSSTFAIKKQSWCIYCNTRINIEYWHQPTKVSTNLIKQKTFWCIVYLATTRTWKLMYLLQYSHKHRVWHQSTNVSTYFIKKQHNFDALSILQGHAHEDWNQHQSQLMPLKNKTDSLFLYTTIHTWTLRLTPINKSLKLIS